MTFQQVTTQQLQAIGIRPATVKDGVTFAANGKVYQGAQFLGETRGIKMFRVTCDGKPKMLAQEQMIAIFG